MKEQVDKIIDAINELDTEEAGMVLAAVVAEFLDAVTDCKIDALCELAAFNGVVAMLVVGDEEAVH